MGYALILSNISFAANNLGQVTPVGGIALSALDISGDDTVSVEGNTATYTAVYTPANATKKGVVWSIESGSEYASINSSTGILTVKEGAESSNVVIKVTSTNDTTISATKTITVTYNEVVEGDTELAYLGTEGGNYVDTQHVFTNSENLYVDCVMPSQSNTTTSTRQFVYNQAPSQSFRNSWSNNSFQVKTAISGMALSKIINGEIIIDTSNCEIYVDGVSQSVSTVAGGGIGTDPIYMFAYPGTSDECRRTDIKIFRITSDGISTFELKPYLHDGVPCFKDTVSGNYYYIVGTANIYYSVDGTTEITYLNS